MDLTGKIIDGKYEILFQAGRGGMGSVYRALHLGTSREVALKVISAQFKDNAEFVGRFRREAEAYGRVQHPNIVNITDFGFHEYKDGKIAYLVMEYLTGRTLSEMLAAEKRFSVAWTVDIIEQICSAVSEIHRNGIIHRDLKPDNILLEPNSRGGYTAKVLDFGIAKIHEKPKVSLQFSQKHDLPVNSPADLAPTLVDDRVDNRSFVNDGDDTKTVLQPLNPTFSNDQMPSKTGADTEILHKPHISANLRDETGKPKIMSDSEKAKTVKNSMAFERYGVIERNEPELTRVGSILGTPHYMSPEQCRSEEVGTSSDIYSLGVITYQMLSGFPPYDGEPISIIAGHLEVKPAKFKFGLVPRGVRKSIYQAMEKDAVNRPESAEIFAAQLRSRSEGLGRLFQRSLVIYIENFFKLLWFGLILYFPTLLLGGVTIGLSAIKYNQLIPNLASTILLEATKYLNIAATVLSETLITAAVAWIVIRYIDAPLRSFGVIEAFNAVLKKWHHFLWIILLRIPLNIMIQGVLPNFSPALVIPLTLVESFLFWMLIPVVMLEELRIRNTISRSFKLSFQSFFTIAFSIIFTKAIYFLIGVSTVIIGYNIASFITKVVLASSTWEDVSVEDFSMLFEGAGIIIIKLVGTVLLPLLAILNVLVYVKVRHSKGESIQSMLEFQRR